MNSTVELTLLPTTTPRPVRNLNSLINDNPGNAELFFERSLAYYESYNIPEKYFQFEKGIYFGYVIRDLDMAISIDPHNPKYYFKRAVVLAVMWDREDKSDTNISYLRIIQDVQKAIQLKPINKEYYKFRATIYCEMGVFSKALEDYDLISQIYPNDYETVLDKAYFFDKMNDYEKSANEFNKAVKIITDQSNAHSSNPSLFNERGCFFMRWKKYSLAIKDFKKANAIHTSSFYLDKISQCLMKMKLYERGLKINGICISKKPKNYSFYITRGKILRKMGQFRKSLSSLDLSIQYAKQSNFFTSFYEKGKTYYCMKMYSRAVIEFIKFQEKCKQNAMKEDLYKNFYWKGMCHLRMKKKKKNKIGDLTAVVDFTNGINILTEHIVKHNIPFHFSRYYKKLSNFFAIRAEANFSIHRFENAFNDYKAMIELYQKLAVLNPNEKTRYLKSMHKIVMNQDHILRVMIQQEDDKKQSEIRMDREKKSNRFVKIGVQLCGKKKYGKGLKEIEKAIQLFPQNQKFRNMHKNLTLEYRSLSPNKFK